MFHGLRKPKFTTKCKSYIKPTKTRLDPILKKKKAVQKYLKNDIAELLQNGLDSSAYGRADGLLVEQSMTFCYERIGTFCNFVLDNLKALQVQKKCPNECKEAVHSLIYAAARCADLPELRSLRTLFIKKFGDSDDSCANKEFVHKLSSRAFTKEMKLQLLHEIAQEHSLKWDSRPLEYKLCKPPYSESEKQKVNEQLQNVSEDTIPKRLHGRNRPGKWGNSSASNRDETEEIEIGVESTGEDESSTDMSSQDGGKACSSSITSVSEDEADNTKSAFYYRFIPPPYLKQKPEMEEFNSARVTAGKGAKDNCESPVAKQKPISISVRRRHLKPATDHEDGIKSPEDENVRGKKTQTPRKEESENLGSPRESGKSKAFEKTHQPQEAKHPKLPEYDGFAARLAALRRSQNMSYTSIG